ncbi:MAG: DNA primase [Anaerolineae bacterium]|nr:DNA primase [Anaerolineae bacterium]
MSVSDDIKARLDLVEFINQYTPLKKAGRNYKGLCPFHGEKTPSFIVFPESQNWRCFGCGRGGDLFNFVMEREGWGFTEALRYLAGLAGVELRPLTPQQANERAVEDRLLLALHETAAFFNHQLNTSPAAEYARAYVQGRGLSAPTIEAFMVGYAPPGWDTTSKHLIGLGFEQADLEAAGLLVVREDGHSYDRFRDRLVIPIHDDQARVVGFGARALAKDAVPKYLNSPQSALFDKSSLLYGFSSARRAIRETETAVIVEGYMDALQAHQAGFTNVVAQMGTALTETQLRLLARYASTLILALDPDAAGQMATERGRETISRVSEQAAEQARSEGAWGFDGAERELRARLTTEFDPYGMVRYENDLGFDIRVLLLPEGQDPDDLIRQAPAEWAHRVANAMPVVEYAIQNALAGKNLDDAKVKSRIVEEITPLINDISDTVQRTHYRQRLARLLRLPESAFFPKPQPVPKEQPRKGGGQKGAPSGPHQITVPVDLARMAGSIATPTASREIFCLAAMLRYPRLLYSMNRAIAECVPPPAAADQELPYVPDILLPYLVPRDYAHPEHQVIFQAWVDALSQHEVEPLEYLYATLDAGLVDRVDVWRSQPIYALRDGLVPPDKSNLTAEKAAYQAVMAVLELREHRLNEYVSELVSMMRDMDNGGTVSHLAEYRSDLRVINETILKLTQKRLRGDFAVRGIGEGST